MSMKNSIFHRRMYSKSILWLCFYGCIFLSSQLNVTSASSKAHHKKYCKTLAQSIQKAINTTATIIENKEFCFYEEVKKECGKVCSKKSTSTNKKNENEGSSSIGAKNKKSSELPSIKTSKRYGLPNIYASDDFEGKPLGHTINKRGLMKRFKKGIKRVVRVVDKGLIMCCNALCCAPQTL